MRTLLLILIAVAVSPAWGADVARPNILFIFTDDHAAHALSCYGSKVNETPHLDRLAAGGARFTNSFVTNSICSPSPRRCLTTTPRGRRPSRKTSRRFAATSRIATSSARRRQASRRRRRKSGCRRNRGRWR